VSDGNGQVRFANLDAGTDITVTPKLPLALRTSFGLQDIAPKTTTLSTGPTPSS
jgi:hypothetical protein